MKFRSYKVDLLSILYRIEDKRNYEDKTISKKIDELQKTKIIEWCNWCGNETEINYNGGKCTHCGKYLLPCSLCDMDKVNCNNCIYERRLNEKRYNN